LYAGSLNLWVFASCSCGLVECSVDEVEGDNEGSAEDFVGRGGISSIGGHIAEAVQQGDVCDSFICSSL